MRLDCYYRVKVIHIVSYLSKGICRSVELLPKTRFYSINLHRTDIVSSYGDVLRYQYTESPKPFNLSPPRCNISSPSRQPLQPPAIHDSFHDPHVSGCFSSSWCSLSKPKILRKSVGIASSSIKLSSKLCCNLTPRSSGGNLYFDSRARSYSVITNIDSLDGPKKLVLCLTSTRY